MPSNQFNREIRGAGTARSSSNAARLLTGRFPPCPYARHRGTDWQLDDGPVTCGVCHPPAPGLAVRAAR